MLRKKTLSVSLLILTLLTINFFNPTNNLVDFSNAHYENLFYHDLIHTRDAWKITNGSKEVTVAVLDSGIDFSHPELSNVAWVNEDEIADNGLDDDGNGYADDINGWDFVFNDSIPGPDSPDLVHWHATFIAGLIAAPLNSMGPVGVAPNVTVMDVRVLDAANYSGTTDEGLGDAIRYAVENGADVINLSLHYYDANDTYYDDIQYAVSQNVAVVSITGNTYPPTGGQEYKSYPGGYDEVIAVGAIDSENNKADYSNYGEWTEIVAPVGNQEDTVRLYSTVPYYTYHSFYGWGYGTSFACPQVAAVIALMKSINGTMPVSEMRTILQETATDLGDAGKDDFFGYGLLNASAALEAMLPPPEEPNGTSISFVPIIASFIFLTAVIVLYKRKK
ncbi:MAG: S8 family serine peptidase [Candidatus Heimdallarchaeota archaeon]|nr:S8 family serine peptidase [Candidatus Heimdallarchaeota archaeon]MCK4878880.1 S8 family serine peptidase [Candidatus Heimdallarchaeota archaeon]